MLLMEKRLLDFKELRVVGIECAKCKTVTLVEIGNPRIRINCASCERPFYDGVRNEDNALYQLAAALKRIGDSTHRITAYIAGAPFEL